MNTFLPAQKSVKLCVFVVCVCCVGMCWSKIDKTKIKNVPFWVKSIDLSLELTKYRLI